MNGERSIIKLTLDQPATYQIKVPGHLDQSWSEWAGGMTITVENGDDDLPITTLTGAVADQAALQGLLRRLYSLGLPLISVNWVESGKGKTKRLKGATYETGFHTPRMTPSRSRAERGNEVGCHRRST